MIASFRPLLATALLFAPLETALAQSGLRTRWADDVSATNALPDYPRMQQQREHWHNLNGTWSYAIAARTATRPTQWDGEILVPFAIESQLSGVARRVGSDQRLWYRRTFARPDWPAAERTLLHFGAVDWQCEVWLNGVRVGEHRGGYDPITFDISGALTANGEQELVVAVWDPTEHGPQPRGKQTSNPGGIWYTPVTGIWQTVWLEPVPACHVTDLHLAGDPRTGVVTVRADVAADQREAQLTVRASLAGREVASATAAAGERELALTIPTAEPWTPDRPTLYDLRIELRAGGEIIDRVDSYVGLRSIELGKAPDGHLRLLLNGEPVFQNGLLDQGFWPDGLYTAPTDAALRFDIETAKRLGFNMLRKHVKVEPDRFYWWCDRLGVLVWQDMPNGDRHIGPRDPDIERSAPSAFGYEQELRALVDALRDHPSIVVWVPFNEGWGQFDTARITRWLAAYDPSRVVDATSGWADRGEGDMHDVHVYPGPGMPPPAAERAAVLGEFGGLGLPLAGHTWQDEKNWGYRSYPDREALTAAWVELFERLRWLQGDGLSASVYTQLTDVEIEVNGLLTYDRAVLKVDPDTMRAANRRLQGPPPRLTTILPTARATPQRWRHAASPPGAGWQSVDFDDHAWPEADAGFGTTGTPGATIGTVWDSADIWLRRTFDLPASRPQGAPHLRIHHDEDAEVWLNGVLAAELAGYTTDYELVPITPAAAATLRPSGNVLAVHCHQTGGGQFIDVGLAVVE